MEGSLFGTKEAHEEVVKKKYLVYNVNVSRCKDFKIIQRN